MLVLGATLGMCIMATANHLLTIFLGVEMASVPSYALAGMLKGRRQSSEAALKYAVYGAGTAGVMLYGISLLAGVLGSAHLPTMASRLADLYAASNLTAGTQMVLALASLMVLVGLAFKLSAVPFHFWCPDVFEGATAEVNAFLSVASKAAALALLVRVTMAFSYIPSPAQPLAAADAAAAPVQVVAAYPKPAAAKIVAVSDTHGAAQANGKDKPADSAARSPQDASRACSRCAITWLSCWRSSPSSLARLAIWPPMARRISSGCWPIPRSRMPAT